MKVVFKARVSVLKQKDTHIRGRGERKVVLDTLVFTQGLFTKDHMHVFPKDWMSEANANDFFSKAKVGQYFEFEGETYTYRKYDGSLSVGVKVTYKGK